MKTKQTSIQNVRPPRTQLWLVPSHVGPTAFTGPGQTPCHLLWQLCPLGLPGVLWTHRCLLASGQHLGWPSQCQTFGSQRAWLRPRSRREQNRAFQKQPCGSALVERGAGPTLSPEGRRSGGSGLGPRPGGSGPTQEVPIWSRRLQTLRPRPRSSLALLRRQESPGKECGRVGAEAGPSGDVGRRGGR